MTVGTADDHAAVEALSKIPPNRRLVGTKHQCEAHRAGLNLCMVDGKFRFIRAHTGLPVLPVTAQRHKAENKSTKSLKR